MSAVLKLDDHRAGEGLRAAELVLQGTTRRVEFCDLDQPLSPGTGADPFLLSSFLLFMENGAPLHIEGPVTRELLANLEEWQGAWALWRPALYKRVEISADEVLTVTPGPGPAISAFSGGVDALYTLHTHLHGLAHWRAVKIESALLVHGFDVPLDQPQVFDRVVERSLKALEGTGVHLRRLRTNLRDLGQRWEDVFALALAASLTLYGDTHDIGLIGSSEPYDALVLPWGSNPVTDPLLSGGHLTVRHEGAGTSRTAKVSALLDWPEVVPLLRFCWEGDQLDRNCGRCEKCLRTACNFYAAGELSPRCFDNPPTPEMVRGLRPRNSAQLAELRSIVLYARQHEVQGRWLDELRRACWLYRARAAVSSALPLRLRQLVGTARSQARRTLSRKSSP